MWRLIEIKEDDIIQYGPSLQRLEITEWLDDHIGDMWKRMVRVLSNLQKLKCDKHWIDKSRVEQIEQAVVVCMRVCRKIKGLIRNYVIPSGDMKEFERCFVKMKRNKRMKKVIEATGRAEIKGSAYFKYIF